MVSKEAVRQTVYGISAILGIKALDISPLSTIFNGRWYIPLGITILLLLFANTITEKIAT